MREISGIMNQQQALTGGMDRSVISPVGLYGSASALAMAEDSSPLMKKLLL